MALGAGIVQFVMFRTNGPVWSLAVVTLFAPLIDRLLPGSRYQWTSVAAMTPARVPATAGAHPGEAGVMPAPAHI